MMTEKKLNEICSNLEGLRNKLTSPIDKQRLNSALAHLRKTGLPSASGAGFRLNPNSIKPGPELDRPGAEKIKEAMLIMEAVVKDLPDRHEKHRVVVEHVVANLKKLVKQNCTTSPEDKMDYDESDDGLDRACAAKKLLEDVPDDLLTEKEQRNFDATMKTIQAFISRVTDRHYRPAKVKWLQQNTSSSNPDWDHGSSRRERSRSRDRRRSRERDRSRDRTRRRRRSRERDRDRDRDRDYESSSRSRRDRRD